jgi:hypothetical protein
VWPRRILVLAARRVARYWRSLTPERQRTHALVGGAVTFAAVVLLTSFPLGELLSQGSALSSTAHGLDTVQQENRVLAGQAAALSNPSAVDNLARRVYGLVPRGQRAFDVLPPSTASAASSKSGEVPLDEGPVAPGSSRSQTLVGVVAPASAPSTRPAKRPAGPVEPRSYWARVMKSLEFWN